MKNPRGHFDLANDGDSGDILSMPGVSALHHIHIKRKVIHVHVVIANVFMHAYIYIYEMKYARPILYNIPRVLSILG